MARSRKKATESAAETDDAAPDEKLVMQDDDTPVEAGAAAEPDAGPDGSTADAEVGADAADAAAPITEAPADPQDGAEVSGEDAPGAPLPGDGAASAARRGTVVPMVLGGAVAAALGFGAAYVLPQFQKTDGAAEQLAILAGDVEAQSQRIAALGADVEALRADPAAAAAAEAQAAFAEKIGAEFDALRETLAGLEDRVAEAAQRLDAVDVRLETLEKRPVDGGAASATALEAFGREMEDLRAEIAAQKADTAAAQEQIAAAADSATARIEAAEAETARLHAEAAEAARAAAVRSAVGRLQASLESGASLEGGLNDLEAAGVTPPPPLLDQAQGVPSLAVLREAFPPAARAALSASLKDTADGTTWDRMTAFLRSQSGARSLSPRAGEDPDAVLSRAEAALGAGDLATAISEIGALPEAGKARMGEWVALAERRIAAVKAVAALADEVK